MILRHSYSLRRGGCFRNCFALTESEHRLATRRMEDEQRKHRIGRLKGPWRCFSLPIQAELQAFLDVWGIEAAEHCTGLLERAFTQRIDRE
jgi:hypothetical protein